MQYIFHITEYMLHTADECVRQQRATRKHYFPESLAFDGRRRRRLFLFCATSLLSNPIDGFSLMMARMMTENGTRAVFMDATNTDQYLQKMTSPSVLSFPRSFHRSQRHCRLSGDSMSLTLSRSQTAQYNNIALYKS